MAVTGTCVIQGFIESSEYKGMRSCDLGQSYVRLFFFFFFIFITYLLICCRIKRRNVTFKMNKEVADFFLFIIALIGVPDLIVLLLLISFYIWIHIIDICTNSCHQRYRLRHKSRVCLQRCVLFQRHANL